MKKQDRKSRANSEEMEFVVTDADYEAGLKRGWTDDEMLRPGRYGFKRGGFLARDQGLKVQLRKR